MKSQKNEGVIYTAAVAQSHVVFSAVSFFKIGVAESLNLLGT